MNKNILTTLIVSILLGAVGFYAGMTYGSSKKSTNTNFAGNFPTQRNGIANRTRNGGNFIAGQIIKQDSSSIVIKIQDGSSKIVYLPDTATIMKSVSGMKNDIKVGENVMVSGTTGSDGSVTAQNVQIRDDNASTTPQFGPPGNINGQR
jgi:hypothetical protein